MFNGRMLNIIILNHLGQHGTPAFCKWTKDNIVLSFMICCFEQLQINPSPLMTSSPTKRMLQKGTQGNIKQGDALSVF